MGISSRCPQKGSRAKSMTSSAESVRKYFWRHRVSCVRSTERHEVPLVKNAIHHTKHARRWKGVALNASVSLSLLPSGYCGRPCTTPEGQALLAFSRSSEGVRLSWPGGFARPMPVHDPRRRGPWLESLWLLAHVWWCQEIDSYICFFRMEPVVNADGQGTNNISVIARSKRDAEYHWII